MISTKLKSKYFRLFDGEYPAKKFAVPIAPENYDCLDIPSEGYFHNWKPIRFIKSKNDGPLSDFVCTDICGRICSPKLRKIIESYHTNADNPIQWLPMLIEDEETGEEVEYYYLHFPEICDTLDLEHSTFSEHSSLVHKPVFAFEKIKNRSIFNCQNSSLITACSKDLKEAMFKSGCTGISVEPAHVNIEKDESKIA